MRFNGTATMTSYFAAGEGYDATGDGTIGDGTVGDESLMLRNATSLATSILTKSNGVGTETFGVKMTAVFVVNAGGTLTVQFAQATTDASASSLTHGVFRLTKCQ
jgi:hypothetical protein